MKTMIIAILLLIIISCYTSGQYNNGAYHLISSMTGETDPSVNIVYSPAFIAAWTMLKEDIIKEDIRVRQEPDYVSIFNKSSYRPVSPAGWVVKAGYVQNGIIDEIKSEMLLKFGEDINTFDEFRMIRDAIICFACLHESVRFKTLFETMEYDFMSGDKISKVSCFGVTRSTEELEKKTMREQVRIYDYRNPDDFIVSIRSLDENKEIIIAKTGFNHSLEYMKELIYYRIARSDAENLDTHDELIIPKIGFSAHKIYTELINKRLLNKGFSDYFFVRADHRVEFQMNESGATVKTDGAIVLQKGPSPRIYAVDKPFFLIVRDKNISEPDLMVWIADDKFLVKANKN